MAIAERTVRKQSALLVNRDIVEGRRSYAHEIQIFLAFRTHVQAVFVLIVRDSAILERVLTYASQPLGENHIFKFGASPKGFLAYTRHTARQNNFFQFFTILEYAVTETFKRFSANRIGKRDFLEVLQPFGIVTVPVHDITVGHASICIFQRFVVVYRSFAHVDIVIVVVTANDFKISAAVINAYPRHYAALFNGFVVGGERGGKVYIARGRSVRLDYSARNAVVGDEFDYELLLARVESVGRYGKADFHVKVVLGVKRNRFGVAYSAAVRVVISARKIAYEGNFDFNACPVIANGNKDEKGDCGRDERDCDYNNRN